MTVATLNNIALSIGIERLCCHGSPTSHFPRSHKKIVLCPRQFIFPLTAESGMLFPCCPHLVNLLHSKLILCGNELWHIILLTSGWLDLHTHVCVPTPQIAVFTAVCSQSFHTSITMQSFVPTPLMFNILRLRQNGCHCATPFHVQIHVQIHFLEYKCMNFD